MLSAFCAISGSDFRLSISSLHGAVKSLTDLDVRTVVSHLVQQGIHRVGDHLSAVLAEPLGG